MRRRRRKNPRDDSGMTLLWFGLGAAVLYFLASKLSPAKAAPPSAAPPLSLPSSNVTPPSTAPVASATTSSADAATAAATQDMLNNFDAQPPVYQ